MSGRLELSRRRMIQASALAAGLGVAAGARRGGTAPAATSAGVQPELAARPPRGFVPLALPGRVVKVSGKGDFPSLMQKNEIWPRPEIARRLLERALMDLTGAPSLVGAMQRFIHAEDVVAIKVNGIGGQKGQTMAVSYELILPVVEACIELGVPPARITVYEQTTDFLRATRVNVRGWQLPPGVRTEAHGGTRVSMPRRKIYGGIETAFATALTEATALIDMTLIKDHSNTGYTGTLKNVVYGSITNPHEHHAHQANPQIAVLYNHPIVTSRVRLHVTDAFRILPDKGPLDRDPRVRVPHGAVYVATDPVAMDTIGWRVVEEERRGLGLRSLAEVGREPRYIRTAGELGLGIHDLNRIRLTSATV